MKRTAVWLASALAACLLLIAIVKFRSGAQARATVNISTAERSRTTAFWTAFNEATALRTHGDCDGAAELYRRALQLNPDHEDSLYYLGSCWYELGNYSRAEDEFRSLIALNPQSGRAYGQLGRVLSEDAPGAAHDLPAAKQAFDRELQIYTEQAGPLLELGGLELNQRNLPGAEQDFRAAARLGSAEAEFLLGYALFLQGRSSEAERSFDHVLAKYRADARLTAKGVLSEGDIFPDPAKPVTALQRAALKAMLLSYWNKRRMGQPAKMAEVAAAHDYASAALMHFTKAAEAVRAAGRGAWADFAGDGHAALATGGATFTLYRWRAGRYADVTAAAGLAGIHDVWEPYWVTRPVAGPDLYLVRPGLSGSGQNLYYRNQGDGTFRDATAAAGLSGKRSTTRACFADFFANGRLDLLEVGAAGGRGSALRLFRNIGTRFVNATGGSGLETQTTAVDCAVADYDGDGKPDIFVQFWRQPARLFRNLGGGKFADATASAGLSGLGARGYDSIFLDYDRDGRPDLLVTAQAPLEQVARWFVQPDKAGNCSSARLFHNEAGGRFSEVTRQAGLEGCYSLMQAVAADFDGDGWPDLLLVSGAPDAQQLGFTLLFHNVEGKFVPWGELPASGVPANYFGAAVSPPGSGGREIYLSSGPLPGGLGAGGVFHIRQDKLAAPSAGRSPRESHVQASR